MKFELETAIFEDVTVEKGSNIRHVKVGNNIGEDAWSSNIKALLPRQLCAQPSSE